MKLAYDENSIGTLEGAQRIRTRPAAILGSDGIDGALHCAIEMYGNIMDEHTSGYGDRIDMKLYSDGSISMRDYGRGVPLGWNEEKQTYNWHLVYNEMYGGGKYDDNQAKLAEIKDWNNFDETEMNYLFSVGLNGLGCAATQYCSEFFDVVSIRASEGGRNQKYEMHFKKGLPIIDGEPVDVFATKYDFRTYKQEIVETDEPTGTFVHWIPDKEVFEDVTITPEWLLNLCKDVSYIAGMSIHCEIESTGEVVDFEPQTLNQLLPSMYTGKVHEVDGEPFVMSFSDFGHGTTLKGSKNLIWVAKCDIAMCIAKGDHRLNSVCYHNMVRMKSGQQYNALDAAVRDFVEHNVVTADGKKPIRDDYVGVFTFAVSSCSNIASFSNQTKDAVTDTFICTFLYNTVYNKLVLEHNKGNKDISEALERVESRANLRIQLREAEKQIKEAERVKRRKEPAKFLTCAEYAQKDYHRTELWITEGDSAKDSVAAARDGAFQAVLPIRGKGLNIFKSSIQRMLANQEAMDIIALLGTGIDLNISGMKLFNIEDLRFDKIIFATDADVDGFHIRVLLFALFYRLCPKLLEAGKVYIAETPRFGLLLNDGSYVYAIDDDECIKKQQEYAGRIKEVKRYKGLGEVDKEILKETTVGVEHRHLIPVTVDFDNELEADIIDALFGEDKHCQRKEILTTVLGQEVSDDIVQSLDLLNQIDSEDIDDGIQYQDVG